MMARISKLPESVRAQYDMSSLRVVWHLGAPCPPWLKQTWIDWLGPEVIWELYAGTEAQAATLIGGVDWLAHRGSVGRPLSGQMKVVRADGTDAAPGEVGEIYMRPSNPDAVTYSYIGAQAKRMDGGWESLGDMGSIDEDGYVYLADRQTDMILAGGSNVYPAEVEAALDEHGRVRSSDRCPTTTSAAVSTRSCKPTTASRSTRRAAWCTRRTVGALQDPADFFEFNNGGAVA
jgi:bile acid-coenzyme A ligase